jgi:hypothetical protein
MAATRARWGDAGVYADRAVKQLGGKFTETDYDTLKYSGTATSISPFLEDYGVWSTANGTTTIDVSYNFLARDS